MHFFKNAVLFLSFQDNPAMSSERVVNVRLLDVNDNHPKLAESNVFICAKTREPVILSATDNDNAPFSQPFTFTLGDGKRFPNWDLTSIDGREANTYSKTLKQIRHKSRCKMIVRLACPAGSTAKLVLKKIPISDFTLTLPINIKDHAGKGVTQGLSGKQRPPRSVPPLGEGPA